MKGAYIDHTRWVFHVSADGELTHCGVPCDQLEHVEGEWAPTVPVCDECRAFIERLRRERGK